MEAVDTRAADSSTAGKNANNSEHHLTSKQRSSYPQTNPQCAAPAKQLKITLRMVAEKLTGSVKMGVLVEMDCVRNGQKIPSPLEH